METIATTRIESPSREARMIRFIEEHGNSVVRNADGLIEVLIEWSRAVGDETFEYGTERHPLPDTWAGVKELLGY